MSILRALLLLSVSIFVAEVGIMYALDYLPIESNLIKNILDAAALVAILFPFLICFVVKIVRQKSEEQVVDAAHELALRQYAIDQAVIFATTDVKGRITWANDMFCEISGYSRQELIGQDHRIVKSGVHSQQFFRDMYRQVANGKIWRGEICNRAKDGSLYWVNTTIVPKLGKGDKPVGYLAIRIDISPQKAIEQALRASEQDALRKSFQINTIVANMSQALCMYDATQRLVICNHQYAQMYGLSPEDVKPGTTLREVVERRTATGIYSVERPRGYLDERIATVAAMTQQIDALSDGRAILVSRQPMPDGGWLTMHQDITALRRNEARIAFLAQHDALTGLANRSHFTEEIERAGARLAAPDTPFNIFMLDLDCFKKINDSLGHAAGDELLKEVARRLQSAVSESDMVARLGGDEFAIIQRVPRAGDPRDGFIADQRGAAIVLANRIIDHLNERFDLAGSKAFIGASIGISLAPSDGRDPEDLLKKADLAVYEAKSNGRNTYCFFDPRMLELSEERHRLEAEMRLGLERGEFELHYQPIVDVKTCEVTGAEALVRWHHPERGLMLPGRFIPLAEDTGLIVPLGEWVLRQACQDAVGWPEHLKVAVNLSAVQFRSCNLLDAILGALAASGLAADRLEVEITETVLLEQETDYLTLLHQLKNVGMSIALDDFGTGYSPLSYLKLFPFDKIKIDRSFTMDIADKAESMAIVGAVIGLGRSLDMITTAEGVETEEQFDIVRAAGVTLAQGFLFGRPCPNAELRLSVDRSTASRHTADRADAAA